MTTTKEQLLIAIESTPEPILAQILDYLEYLKTKPRILGLNYTLHPDQSNNSPCLALLRILEPFCHPIRDRTR
ncbi:MAG: hypothetical protein RH949_09530 [Coleofasciculus sp. A1-SPW-01]|uniref:hypothetical protein n=1 Tax=Coleofasciculus sp. A1-SPW-01 TaxID=3070819 RepID=UPI0032F5E437